MRLTTAEFGYESRDADPLPSCELARMLIDFPHETLVLVLPDPEASQSELRVGNASIMVVSPALLPVETVQQVEAALPFSVRILFRQRQWCDVVVCHATRPSIEQKERLSALVELLQDDKIRNNGLLSPVVPLRETRVFELEEPFTTFAVAYPHVCQMDEEVSRAKDEPLRPSQTSVCPISGGVTVGSSTVADYRDCAHDFGDEHHHSTKANSSSSSNSNSNRACHISVLKGSLVAMPIITKQQRPALHSAVQACVLPVLAERLAVAHRRVFSSLRRGPMFHTDPPSSVLPYLTLGSAQNASNWTQLRSLGVTHILIVGKELARHYPQHFQYLHFHLVDTVEERGLTACLEPAYRFISSCQQSGGLCLVHCFCGISRSAAVVVGYLMRSRGLCFDDALAYVRAKRPIVCPNAGLEEQLRAYGGALSAATAQPPSPRVTQPSQPSPVRSHSPATVEPVR